MQDKKQEQRTRRQLRKLRYKVLRDNSYASLPFALVYEFQPGQWCVIDLFPTFESAAKYAFER